MVLLRTNGFPHSSYRHIAVPTFEQKSPAAFESSAGKIQEVFGQGGGGVDHSQLLLLQNVLILGLSL